MNTKETALPVRPALLVSVQLVEQKLPTTLPGGERKQKKITAVKKVDYVPDVITKLDSC